MYLEDADRMANCVESDQTAPTLFAQTCTPQPLYNTVRYNTVLDTIRTRVGPQIAIEDSFT